MEPAAASPVNQKRVMEALIFALGKSEISRVVNVGTLRYFIEFTLRDMIRGTSFDLGPLWHTLAAEPGLTPEMIYPPLLLFGEWQGRLGIAVTLPPPMQALSPGERDGHLARIQVPEADLDRLLEPVAPAPASPSGRLNATATASRATAPGAAVPPRVAPRLSEQYLRPGAAATKEAAKKATAPSRRATASKASSPRPNSPRRQVTMVVALVIALASFGYAGTRLFGHRGSKVSLARVSNVLKLESARRLEYVVTAEIADPRWDGMPPAARREAVEAVFKTLEPDGVKSLILRDSAGKSRATISTVGGRRMVEIH